ncbi:MAG: EAL domain-containing protein [Zoogloeaceae bacterium]|nr:EAL domain-containing protein [Zoogloeaceae bacterium]
MSFWYKLSVRVRLILVFIAIKVLPLMLLLWIAWNQTQKTADDLKAHIHTLTETSNNAIHQVGDMAIDDAIKALDERATDAIERLSTDTANRVAEFLYERDADILIAAQNAPDATAYRRFVDNKRRNLARHGKWRLNADKSAWEPETPVLPDASSAEPGSKDNVANFHYRPPTVFKSERLPLYLEMTFVGLDGKERVKVTTSDQVSPTLKDVSQRRNTFARAETYFAELKKLKPGEIYVSDVIGAYVGSPIIGPFTPAAAEKRGIAFEPEKHAYAGKENPVGKRFQGIVRWATPVVQDGKIIGWVTLALNHDHLMSFTDHIVPTEERYRDINDAFDGNYAFIWDYKGRSIVHPRHHSIVGYDKNGEPAVPWLASEVFADWRESGKSWRRYMETAPTFVDQLQSKKAESSLTASGNVGLDCRYLNFAPQCTGWYNLADNGGSGSFLILWSGLWKLTTTSAIPYYTGQYSPAVQGNRRGFGIVTIGANVDDFHKAANASEQRLNTIIEQVGNDMKTQGKAADQALYNDMKETASNLAFSTFLLIAAVIIIALWLASYLSRRISWLNDGFNRFRMGEKHFRFRYKYQDEITSLAATFNEMADTLNEHMLKLEGEIVERTHAESELHDIKENLKLLVDKRTQELSEANRQLSEEVDTRRIAEEKARYLAGHDPLTGLANRMLFNEQLERAISQSARSGKYGALLFFDLDHFKQTNDSMGHTTGDALLAHMASILQERVRKTDIAARLGGDEFAVIATELESPESAAILARSILEKLQAPVTLTGHEMQVRTSIGIATFQGVIEADEIIRRADLAMYASKANGGMRFHFFERGLQEKLETDLQCATELRLALDKHQFIPYFQPLYHTVERRVLYLEVLGRWAHPQKGLLSISEFMSIATRNNLMVEIDMQLMHIACSQASAWLASGLPFGRISINIIPSYLERPEFVSVIQEILLAHRLSPQYLAFELSEYALLKGSPQSIQSLHKLRELGIQILVDRLEIERSVLKNLLEYPLDAIKINCLFTEKAGDPDQAMIKTLAAVARAHGLLLIAEGVENETQWDYFTTMDCEIIQGYKHAYPMSANETGVYLGRYLDNHGGSGDNP